MLFHIRWFLVVHSTNNASPIRINKKINSNKVSPQWPLGVLLDLTSLISNNHCAAYVLHTNSFIKLCHRGHHLVLLNLAWHRINLRSYGLQKWKLVFPVRIQSFIRAKEVYIPIWHCLVTWIEQIVLCGPLWIIIFIFRERRIDGVTLFNSLQRFLIVVPEYWIVYGLTILQKCP